MEQVMKNYITILLVIIFNLYTLFSQETIDLNKGITIFVDGKISQGEWDDAQFVNLQSSGNKIVRIMFKHDGENLLFAFLDNLGSANFRFPEIFFDINNDKSDSWMNDDWWFHVSATNCFNRGAHSVYNINTCKTVQPGWQANNFSASLPDTVEIKIPFSLVELDTNRSEVGIAFDVTDTYSAWEFYPAGANINSPATWLNAIINYNTSGIESGFENNNFVDIFPNPTNDEFTIQVHSDELSTSKIILYNSYGLEIEFLERESDSGNNSITVNTSSFPNGVYFVRVGSKGNEQIVKPVVIIK